MKKNRMKSFVFILLILAHGLVVYGIGNEPFTVVGSGIKIYFDFQDGKLRNQVMLPTGFEFPATLPKVSDHSSLEIAVQSFGENKTSGNLFGGDPGNTMLFVSIVKTDTPTGKHYVITQKDVQNELKIESHYIFYNDAPVIRRFTKVINESSFTRNFDYISSAIINNFLLDINRETLDQILVHWASNTWMNEGQWRSNKPADLNLVRTADRINGNISFVNKGSSSSSKYLPMGMVENTKYGITWFWQIEHAGPWVVSIEESERGNNNPYIYLGGTDYGNHNSIKQLKPGESFETIPVAIGVVKGGFNEAVAALTDYRRVACKREHAVDDKLPVIFNDYMNCLSGNPTTAKLLPVVDAAARAGCEYFVIDAGWYAELKEDWWSSIGVWQPSKSRFPNGIGEVFDSIKKRGMIPGMWLEIEMAGINSQLKNKPDNWFFNLYGKRVIEGSRFFLDYRNPEVSDFATGVVDRLINDYGIGYIKKDLNCSAPYGTDLEAESPGQGMLEHMRAQLKWTETIHQKHPELILENCAGGGLRLDYSMLSQYQLQSSTDQTNYKLYPAIMVGLMAAVLPEQLAGWSYPLAGATSSEASFNMVTSMAGRIHQSGDITHLNSSAFNCVKEGIQVYKTELRNKISHFTPFFPNGLPNINDTITPVVLGMKYPDATYYWIWRLSGENKIVIKDVKANLVSIVYPELVSTKTRLTTDKLEVELADRYSAVILKVNE
jgi:alpha-galactosidase